jgi:hypothetical protein
MVIISRRKAVAYGSVTNVARSMTVMLSRIFTGMNYFPR